MPSSAPASSPAFGESPLVPPFSWIFRNPRHAILAYPFITVLLWLCHLFIRVRFFPEEKFFFRDEFTILLGFVSAGVFSILLPLLFCGLCRDLIDQRSSLAETFNQQYRKFHSTRWLITGPLLLSALCIFIRYFSGGGFYPFDSLFIDATFCVWLFWGFFFILNATVLCARYTEIVRLLEKEAAEGKLGRNEIHLLSRFYLKVALIATIHFGFCSMIVYSIHMIFTYKGTMIWSGFQLIRWKAGLTLGQQIAAIIDDPLFVDVLIFFIMHGAVSVAPIVYIIFPQWGIHKLLMKRKGRLLDKVRFDLEQIEERLGGEATRSDLEEFSRLSQINESLEKLPEWPFEGGGKVGTVLFVGIPSLLLLFKEVLLEVLVQVFTK